jgi:tRNA nucleotidyltransferase (CCA-adding enzyme)
MSPEAYNLLGYCAALEGNAEDAVEAYRQAIALDDTYFEAMLNAAEVYIHPLRDFEEAMKMCDHALELAETDDELVDALLLKFDALLGQGEPFIDEARGLLERVPPPPYENPTHTFLVGRAFYEVADLQRATALIEEAASKDPKHAEAWYYLGLLRDEQGESAAATSAFLRARELDLALPTAPWTPSREVFTRLCREAIEQLDSVLGSYVRYADVFVSDVPGIELVADGVDPRALLLFDGINLPDRPGVPCARVFFYQRNLERLAGSAETLEEEVRSALEREVTLTFLQSEMDTRTRKELNLAMRPTPEQIAAQIPDPVRELCRRLRRAGKKAWVVGGSVRDLLRGMAVADYDVCTDALPTEVQKIFPRVIPTGIEHGTVSVLLGGVPYEVTTLRGESAYSDGRRPDKVTFLTDIEADLARRDFTVNAIAFDLETNQLVDPFGGMADLDRKLIRAVGSPRERFEEDGLRVLRAARFVASLEADLDPATESAINETLGTFRKVSAERVREEWLKAMKARKPSRAFDVMLRTGILGVTCPELAEGAGVEQNRHHSYDVWGHAMSCLDACEGDVILRTAALLHDVGKPRTRAFSDKTSDYTFYNHEQVGADMADAILTRMKFSNDEKSRIVSVVRNHLICYEDSWSDGAVRRWLRRVTRERTTDLYALARADNIGKGRPTPQEFERIDHLASRVEKVILAGDAITTKALTVDGTTLMRELNLRPGRHIGQLLEALLEHVLENPEDNQPEILLGLARALTPPAAPPAAPAS